MKNVDLINFNEILLTGDIKYLRFVDKNTNKLYMVEDYSQDSLEDKINILNKLNTIDEVKNYFINKDSSVKIFEFIPIMEIKKYYDVINKMNSTERTKLALIIKNVQKLKIRYINFTYFFVQTEDEKIYYVNYNQEKKLGSLKNLKIKQIFHPADYQKIVKEIKTYGAFKYQNRTIKYEDIKLYIENPLISPKQDNILITGIRNELLKEKINGHSNKISYFDFAIENKEDNKNNKENTVKLFDKKDNNKSDIKTNDIVDSNNKTDKIVGTSKKMDKKHSKSLFMYCFVGFSIGIVLAAITILIGSFI